MSEFEQLVDQHYQGMYRFAMSLAKNPDCAADLVQQTFCIWAQKGSQLEDRSKAKTWLYTTLHREFLADARRRNRYPEAEVSEATGVEKDEAEAERQLDGQRVVQLLSELDETFRAPLALFYLQQHSYKEIAEVLDVPIGTVMSRISRAKEMLRRRMTEEPLSAPKNILQIQPEVLKASHG